MATDNPTNSSRPIGNRRKPSNSPSRRGKYYKQNYGIRLRGYRKLLKQQDFRCAICQSECNQEGKLRSGTKRRLAVDHCHDSKKVRGLLCPYCNTALGLFKDNVESLRRAIAYLQGDLFRVACADPEEEEDDSIDLEEWAGIPDE